MINDDPEQPEIIQNCFVCDSDYARGFGGKYGVEKEKQDRSAAGWDYQTKLAQHESQRAYELIQCYRICLKPNGVPISLMCCEPEPAVGYDPALVSIIQLSMLSKLTRAS
ncbi:unnamed protein product [Anisakis simplex]|uniref:CN hydrolase domain-containing protein n=1 Tax=Anisakis simplex TaxID=6269 RepID=A0A0M3KKP9_ANISI|nr:unnamed protein product [Anisakis simplex]